MIAHLALLALAAVQPAQDADAQKKCATVLEAQAARLRAQSHMLLADADYAEAHNNEMSPEMTQRYVNWYRQRKAEGANYPDLHLTKLSISEQNLRQRSIDDFVNHEKRERERLFTNFRSSLIQACPWKANEIRAGRWPEGL